MTKQKLTPSEIDNIVRNAEEVLRCMFDVEDKNFLEAKNRERNNVEARRFLMYFLKDEFELTNKQVLKRIEAVKNHATIIHHKNKLNALMSTEAGLRDKYDYFRYTMINEL